MNKKNEKKQKSFKTSKREEAEETHRKKVVQQWEKAKYRQARMNTLAKMVEVMSKSKKINERLYSKSKFIYKL